MGDVGYLEIKRRLHRNTDLDIDLISAENNGDVFADTLKITMPVGHVLVSDSRCHVEHNDTALALDVVPIAESAKLLLSSRVPNVEAYGSKVGGECKRMNFDTKGG